MREGEHMQQRWGSATQFLADWYGPLRAEDGLPAVECTQAEVRLGIVLPQPLKAWYTTVGRRADIHSVQNCLLSPWQLEIRDDHVIVALENQSVVAWGIAVRDLGSADPPVLVDLDFASSVRMQQWVAENSTLSEFLLQMVMHEALFATPFCGNAPLDRERLRKIEPHYPYLRFPAWHWPVYPTRFLGDRETLVVINGDEWMWVAAKNQSALVKAAAQLPVTWAYLWKAGYQGKTHARRD